MGRAPCCDKANVKRGPWSPEEDTALKNYVQTHGTGGNWIALPHKAGLKRCGKSCRLRWLNYLRPDIKHGGFTEEEDNIICTLYKTIGSRWSVIASQLPGRTDNDVKNYWNTKLKKKLLAGNTNNITNITTTTTTATTTSSSHVHYFSSSSSSSSPNTILNNHDDIDNYGFLSSTFLTHQNLSITPSMDAAVGDLGQAVFSSQRIVLDPTIHHDSFPHQPGVLMDATKLGKSSGNNIKSDIASSCQEISGLSSVAASSPFRVEESCFFWSGNGGGIGSVDDRSLMSFGFNSNYDNNGLGFHQERIPSEAAAENLASYYSLFDNFLDDPSDAKSKGVLYQSIRN